MNTQERKDYASQVFEKPFPTKKTHYYKTMNLLQERSLSGIPFSSDNRILLNWDKKKETESYFGAAEYIIIVFTSNQIEGKIKFLSYTYDYKQKLLSNTIGDNSIIKNVLELPEYFPDITYTFFDFSGLNLL